MADSNLREPTQMSLRALKLRPGMFLQTQPVGGSGGGEAQFCAAIEGRGIMVVPLGDAPALKPGETHLVSGFTGMYDFAFEAQVIQLFTYPFPYTLLAYPSAVRAKKVRNALRMPTEIEAVVTLPKLGGTVAVTLVDLSVAGAMVSCDGPLGGVGDPATVDFAIGFEGRPVDLSLKASICHTTKTDAGDGYRVGFAFRDSSRNDRLVLQYFTLKVAEELGGG